MSDRDLDRLLDLCKAGDTRAWGDLVDRFQGLVYSVPRRFRLNEDDCADVFMATFQALYHHRERIERGSGLPRWLSTTAVNETLRLIRFQARTTVELPLEGFVDEALECPQKAISRCEDAYRVRAAIRGLPDRCRDLLEALYADEPTSYEAVSQRLGVPLGSVGPTRARCLEKLRFLLDKDGFFD